MQKLVLMLGITVLILGYHLAQGVVFPGMGGNGGGYDPGFWAAPAPGPGAKGGGIPSGGEWIQPGSFMGKEPVGVGGNYPAGWSQGAHQGGSGSAQGYGSAVHPGVKKMGKADAEGVISLEKVEGAEGQLIEFDPPGGKNSGGKQVLGLEPMGEGKQVKEVPWSEPSESSFDEVAKFNQNGELEGGALLDALNKALENGDLNQEQFNQAKQAIQDFLKQFPDIANAKVTMQTAELPDPIGQLIKFNIEGYGTITIGPDVIDIDFIEQQQAGLLITWGEKGFNIYSYPDIKLPEKKEDGSEYNPYYPQGYAGSSPRF